MLERRAHVRQNEVRQNDVPQNIDNGVLAPGTPNSCNTDLLNSWKDICAYLSRGVRTVQRWEETQQLPVYRIGIGSRAPVFAFKHELDAWLLNKASKGLAHSDSVRVSHEHFNSRQRRLIQLVQQFRQSALELEQAIVAEGLESDVNIMRTLLTIQKLVNAELSKNQLAPVQATRDKGVLGATVGRQISGSSQAAAV
ncbi:MAG TPA: hypothetical protein VGU90_07385 [Terriglobales bacterium]|nr:hypothetical protein [Terriglobales bacterium]